MIIRKEVQELADLGRFPLEEGSSEEQVAVHERALPKILGPVSDEEARVLVGLFPEKGSTFGLAWQLVHLIETAPGWPLADVLDGASTNEWIAHLRQTARNTRALRRGNATD